MGRIFDFLKNYFGAFSSFSTIKWIDVVEILLIAVFVYQFMLWIRNTRAYSFKGNFNCIDIYFCGISLADEYHFVVGVQCRRVCDYSDSGYLSAGAQKGVGRAGA